ncbi:MAG TPA: TIGR04282 family arsenosugar biosynthesis glycosyltransferase [Pseudolabrys sp.]|nr:TIGR04282 family arsenosugar biosynthesis glycosyltransferase [Pseudolabrys sp.]
MSHASLEPVAIAVLAKAPIPGLAKTRLIPEIGAHAAAVLQERLTEGAIGTAVAADTGPVTLWCAPELDHSSFQDLAARFPITLKRQPDDDLGVRMLAAIAANNGPTIVIGTDCPSLGATHLREAAAALCREVEVVVTPAEDGGYVLIGARQPHAALFENMAWGAHTVIAETRARLAAIGLMARELNPLWDVDRPADLARLEREHAYLAL